MGMVTTPEWNDLTENWMGTELFATERQGSERDTVKRYDTGQPVNDQPCTTFPQQNQTHSQNRNDGLNKMIKL